MEEALTPVLQAAIARAKRRQVREVEPEDVLAACLLSIARFGVARIGPLAIDLDAVDIDWIPSAAAPSGSSAKVAYAEATVALLDAAAAVARADQAKRAATVHLLVAFTRVPACPLWTRLGVDSATWRSALAAWEERAEPDAPVSGDSYLSPEQAAELLGVHHQTIRGYIRSGKLAALRIAGERAVRIRRESLRQLMEPFTLESE